MAVMSSVANKGKSKHLIDIEAKINRMILNPQLYEEFLEEFALRKKKAMLENAWVTGNENKIDLVKRNKEQMKNFVS
jgi:hypothetical protein